MNERPKWLCKFRGWKATLERDRQTREVIERHRSKEMLQKAEFFCQPPRFFDDPHDGLQGARATGLHRDIDRFAMHNIGAEVLDVMRRNRLGGITQLGEVTDPGDVAIIKRAERKHTRRKTRVLSLSANPTSELMWSFYAESHQGICLCFDAGDPLFVNAKPVRYVDDPCAIEDPADDEATNDPLLYCKGKAWEWQQEWRLAWAGEEPMVIPFPREALKAVILGEWFHRVSFDQLIETLTQGGYRVEVLQMERLPNSFGYQIVPIRQIK